MKQNFEIIRSEERGKSNMGWLNSRFSFSFAQWFNPNRIQFGALRVINDDIIAPECGFDMHPHDNMEIITIVRKGVLKHRDTMGHESVIVPGEVQVMSAGSGLFHAEYNHSETEKLELFQIWIFPNVLDIKPRYEQAVLPFQELKDDFMPIVLPMSSDKEWLLKIHQEASLYYGQVSSGKTIHYTCSDASKGIYVFVMEGSVQINEQTLNARDAMTILNPSETISFFGLNNSEILVFEVPMSI